MSTRSTRSSRDRGSCRGSIFQGPPRGQARLHRRAAAEGAGRDCAGGFRGVQTRVGDVIGWRNLFWAFTESMAGDPKPWIGDTLIPTLEYARTYRMFMIEGYPRMKEIIEQDVASGLIDLPSSALDFQEPAGAAVSGQVRPRIGRPARGRPCERREGAAGFGRFGVWRPPRALRAQLLRQPRERRYRVRQREPSLPQARSTSATRVAAVADGMGQRATQSSQIDARAPPESAEA
jgi:hypothetical protein